MVMKYLFDKDNSYTCVYEGSLNPSTVEGVVTDGSSYASVKSTFTTSSYTDL
jgi:hypothetical protein